MADTDILNLNGHISYPLVEGDNPQLVVGSGPTLDFPKEALLDLTVFIAPVTLFDPSTDELTLYSVQYTAGVLRFTFKTATTSIFLQGSVAGKVWGDYITVSDGTDAAGGYFCIGDLTALIAALTAGTGLGIFSFLPRVEPACVHTLMNRRVSSLQLANQPRTRADDWCDSSSSSSEELADDVRVEPPGGTLTGDLIFTAGYNATVAVRAATNSLVFGAGVGSGLGPPQGEIPITAEEVVLAGLGLPLDNAVHCADVIFTINGVHPSSAGAFAFETNTPGLLQTEDGCTTIAIAPGDVCTEVTVQAEF